MLLIKYLRSRIAPVLLFLILIAAFIAACLLYRVPAGAVIYPAALASVLGLVILTCGFLRTRSRHQVLRELCEESTDIIKSLPEALTVEEEDYRAIVSSLCDRITALSSESSAKLNETVDYYTAWVHQIKTPIASMRLTLQNSDTAESRRLSSDLMRIEQYVEMVLAYLRLESDASDYVFKEYPLDPLIRQAVKRFAAEFIDRRLSLDYSGTDKTAVTDEKWLVFVIEQVLSNALKYTKTGGIKIYFEEPLTLCISDTGAGISPEDLPRIFEKGYTGLNGRKDKRASGIGLWLCRRICRNLGAEITAESAPDIGTTVKIDLSQYDLKAE